MSKRASGDSESKPVQSRARAKLEAICARIEGGTHQNHACALEGVPRQTYYDLLGRDPEAAAMVAKARAVAAEALRARVQLVAEGCGEERANANVLLHLLERAHPEEYGPPKQRLEQSGPDGGPIKTESAVKFYVPVNPRIPTETE